MNMSMINKGLIATVLIVNTVNSAKIHHAVQTLESPILHAIDGNFLNADTLERVFSFKREIMNIMWGSKNAQGNLTGLYNVNNKFYSADELEKIEQQKTSPAIEKELATCLKNMKADFLKSSNKLKSIAQGAKSAMVVLIDESCRKHHRPDSMLLL